MQFVLTIAIEPDCRRELVLALRREAARIERTRDEFSEGDTNVIRDADGTIVGEWKVENG